MDKTRRKKVPKAGRLQVRLVHKKSPECVAALKEAKEVEMRYVSGIPRRPLPPGKVLVHNHVVPALMELPWGTRSRRIFANGFRAWTQKLDDGLEVCPCDWAGVDLRGIVHYRVKAEQSAEK